MVRVTKSFTAQGGTRAGVYTTAKSPSHSKPKQRATQRWHQGFGTIKRGGQQCVPFVTELACRRIAARAELAVSRPMRVFQAGGLWLYREAD